MIHYHILMLDFTQGCVLGLLFLLLFLGSCAPTTLADLQCQGEAEMKKLTHELRQIESREDVQKASKRLAKRFNQVGEILIATRKFPPEETRVSSAGEELFAELARLYEIPGVKEAIEMTQSEAIRSLDRSRKRTYF